MAQNEVRTHKKEREIICWLIEYGSPTVYYIDNLQMTTDDPWKARRFSSKEEAAEVRKEAYLLPESKWRIEEHIFYLHDDWRYE